MTDSPAQLVHPPVLTPIPDHVPDDELSIDDLGSRIVGLSGRIAAATCRWLLLVADFDRREGGARFGLPSTARWLAHHCGIAHRTAVEHVRAAKALASFPRLAEAMGAGALSYSHIRAIARLARDDEPRLVADLIEIARHGTVAQLEITVRGLRTVDDTDSPCEKRPEEYVRFGWTSGSQASVSARLDPERGALVQSAVETLARAEGITQVEALERMAEITLATINCSASPAPALRGDERTAVVIHLDASEVPAEALDSATAADPSEPAEAVAPATAADPVNPAGPIGRPADTPRSRLRPRSCERGRPYARVERGPGLTDSVVKRLLCSGRIRTAVHARSGTGCDLGRSHRVVSDRLFRALLLRDGGCAHPGCGSRHGLEAHHVRHWINGGPTDLANLVLLCRAHHHGHHDGEFTIVAHGDGRFRFLRSDGRELIANPDPPSLASTGRPIEDEHDTEPTAATRRWAGERLERRWAIDCLAIRRAHARAG